MGFAGPTRHIGLHFSAPPKWGQDRWGCENFPFNFIGDVLWKVCAQERYVGSRVSERNQARQ